MKKLTGTMTKNKLSISLGLLLSITSASFYVSADDIEIYLQEPPDPVPPNVLFVLDESGSMASSSPSRRDQLVDAMQQIINDSDMGNVNAALLGYTTNWGNNGPLFLNARTGNFKIIDDYRSDFLSQVDDLQTLSYTPTVKAMENAVAWFRNDQTFTDVSNNTMTSPIAGDPEDNWCKPNHIVLLSDGEPNSNATWNYGLSSYEGTSCASDWTSVYQNGRCAREIAAWAYTNDLETGTGWDEVQNIRTHTVGFNTNTQTGAFLTSIATSGGGSFYPAGNASDIVDAFQSILTEAQASIPYTYTAPVIPFNQDNSAVSGNRIFVPMFVPAVEKLWKGNIKSYTITTSTTAGEISIVLEDRLGQPIVNPDTNQFVDSTDWWSNSSDGADPLVGGAAAHFTTTTSRNLYTNANPSAVLSDSTNRVHDDNANITEGMLGVASSALRTDLLNWISWDPSWVPASPEDESHVGVMGAPLHTQPAVQHYSTNGDVIYLPTTEGVLEAIDAETGEELWAFMPTDLLPEILTIKNNDESATPYYGLDGPLTLYETGGRKMAAFGMRRGGRNYYILDITNRLAPEYVATISNATLGSTKLGQTWSKPIFATMEIEGATAQDVLVFGGGYDPSQDTTTTRVDDNEGNAIFIVSASDGHLIKTISNSAADLVIADMDNAIASDLLPVDINTNGITDRLYAADVGGRIIRIDIPDSDFASTALSGGVIADINDGTTEFRRFFNTPEVGYFNRGGNQFLAILIGTGNRPAPLDSNVTDRFYMLKDYGVWTAPGTYVATTESDLYDASANLVQDGSSAEMLQANADLLSTRGWYIDFRTAEKSLSKAVLYNYAVLFTTYSAQRSSDMALCEARGTNGVARFYSIDMIDASAKFDGLGGAAGTLDINDRSKVLNILGMPPSPTLVFPGGENGMVGQVVKALVGLEEVYEWPDRFIPISWEEVIE